MIKKNFIEFECYFLSGMCLVHYLILISQGLLFLLHFCFFCGTFLHPTHCFLHGYFVHCLLRHDSRFPPFSFRAVFLTSKMGLACDEDTPLLSSDSKLGMDNVSVIHGISRVHTSVMSSKVPTLPIPPVLL